MDIENIMDIWTPELGGEELGDKLGDKLDLDDDLSTDDIGMLSSDDTGFSLYDDDDDPDWL